MPTSRWSRLFVILMAATPLAAAAEEPQEKSTTLVFAWPSNLVADVSYQAKRSEWRGANREMALSGTYRVSVSPNGEGLLVRHDAVRLEVEPSKLTGEEAGKLQAMANKLISRPIDFAVGRNGEFLGARGVSEFQEEARAALLALIEGAPEEVRQNVERFVTTILSDNHLQSAAARDWHLIVGAWAGANLDVGAVYEFEAETPFPLLGNAPVPIKHRYRYLGRAACDGGDVARRCVELEQQTAIDAEKIGGVLAEFTARLAPGLKFERIEREDVISLISEPTTLRPYSVKIRSTVEVAATENESPRHTKQFSEKTYVYTYR